MAGECRAAGFGLGDVPMEATRGARPMPSGGGVGGDAWYPGLRPAVAALPGAHPGLRAAVAARLGRMAIERTVALQHGRVLRGKACASRDRQAVESYDSELAVLRSRAATTASSLGWPVGSAATRGRNPRWRVMPPLDPPLVGRAYRAVSTGTLPRPKPNRGVPAAPATPTLRYDHARALGPATDVRSAIGGRVRAYYFQARCSHVRCGAPGTVDVAEGRSLRERVLRTRSLRERRAPNRPHGACPMERKVGG
jgi:hypothetical protein